MSPNESIQSIVEDAAPEWFGALGYSIGQRARCGLVLITK